MAVQFTPPAGVQPGLVGTIMDEKADVVDVTDLGLDRFDEHGRSRLAPDPIALPFPDSAD